MGRSVQPPSQPPPHTHFFHFGITCRPMDGQTIGQMDQREDKASYTVPSPRQEMTWIFFVWQPFGVSWSETLRGRLILTFSLECESALSPLVSIRYIGRSKFVNIKSIHFPKRRMCVNGSPNSTISLELLKRWKSPKNQSLKLTRKWQNWRQRKASLKSNGFWT